VFVTKDLTKTKINKNEKISDLLNINNVA